MTKWKISSQDKTILMLMKAVHLADGDGIKFLREKYVIAIKVVSLNAVDGEVYLIQHYVKKLRQVGDFLRILLYFNDMMMSPVLDKHTWLDFYSASSLRQQSMDRHMSPHST
jgi:hypothetical protein